MAALQSLSPIEMLQESRSNGRKFVFPSDAGKDRFMQDVKTSTNLLYVIFLGATAALGGMMFGFDLAIIVGAGPFLVEYFSLGDFGLGWAYSSLLFGCVLGSVIAGRLTDQYGRQKILLFVALLF